MLRIYSWCCSGNNQSYRMLGSKPRIAKSKASALPAVPAVLAPLILFFNVGHKVPECSVCYSAWHKYQAVNLITPTQDVASVACTTAARLGITEGCSPCSDLSQEPHNCHHRSWPISCCRKWGMNRETSLLREQHGLDCLYYLLSNGQFMKRQCLMAMGGMAKS